MKRNKVSISSVIGWVLIIHALGLTVVLPFCCGKSYFIEVGCVAVLLGVVGTGFILISD